MNILISINPPYSDMILNGEKGTEYRKQIVSSIKRGDKLFIYETKNKGGSGKVIGCVEVKNVFSTMYIKGTENLKLDIQKERYMAVKEEYLHWCAYKGIRPNMNEGWFSSKKFIEHLKNIGGYEQNYNYAIALTGAYKFNAVYNVNDFLNLQNNPFKKPPQNMCRCLSDLF